MSGPLVGEAGREDWGQDGLVLTVMEQPDGSELGLQWHDAPSSLGLLLTPLLRPFIVNPQHLACSKPPSSVPSPSHREAPCPGPAPQPGGDGLKSPAPAPHQDSRPRTSPRPRTGQFVLSPVQFVD